VRVQALFTLRGLGLLSVDELTQALRKEWPHVRGTALAAAGADALMPAEIGLLDAQQRPTAASLPSPAALPVIGSFEPDRQKIVARYLAAATLPGDAARGRQVLQRGGCIACHKHGGAGPDVGPDLATVAGKPPAQLIEAIFDPNRAVEQRYTVTTFVLHDGTAVSGLIVAETPGSVTLRMAGGMERVIRRGAIDESHQHATSIMPVGLEAVLSLQDCADLLAALRPR